MTAVEILKELEQLGSASYKKTMLKHGAQEPLFGVKIEDMKKRFVKPIKKDYQLALDLFDTGNSDAMYLAGLLADETRMTKKDLQKWAKQATWSMISEYSVAWVTSESPFGFELALEWIDSKDEKIMATGWATLSSLVMIQPDDKLKTKELSKLLDRVAKTIHKSPNRVRYSMNGFVIAVGCAVVSLSEKAVEVAQKVGPLDVELIGACQLPDAVAYIAKVAKMGRIGHKRKAARC